MFANLEENHSIKMSRESLCVDILVSDSELNLVYGSQIGMWFGTGLYLCLTHACSNYKNYVNPPKIPCHHISC